MTLRSQDFQSYAFALERRERDLASVAFCFDVYVDFLNGREPTENMDLTKATDQLVESVARLLGVKSPLPPDCA